MVKHKFAFLVMVRLCCVFAILLLNFAHKPPVFSTVNFSSQFYNGDAGNLSPSELKSLLAFQICTTNSSDTLDKKHPDQNNQDCHDNTPCHACRIGGQLLVANFASEIIQHKLKSFKNPFLVGAKPNRKFYFNYTTPARAPPLV